MNKEDLEKLIDIEVSKVFSDEPLKEPEKKVEISNEKNIKQTNLTEDELDEILFGKKEKK
jgi:hypothetical protein